MAGMATVAGRHMRGATTMTDATDQARLERIEALRNRRRAPDPTANGASPAGRSAPARARKRHPALGSRIAVTGLGATAMLGLVTTMGLTSQAPAAASNAPVSPSVRVVVERTPANQPTGPGNVGSAAGPIVLNANPVVRTVQAAPNLRARTNGSR